MTKTPQILVFGEDDHDRSAIRLLVQGLRPDLRGSATIVKRRAPMTLVKDMDRARRLTRAGKVVAVVRAEHVKAPVRACVFHEDTDQLEPSHLALARDIHEAYARCHGVVVAAVAAWEVEAWWYLFPDAVAAVRSSWRAPDRHAGGDCGRLTAPKEKLRRDVRPAGLPASAAFRGYEPSDSEDVARSIVDGGWLTRPTGTSRSWDAFVSEVGDL